MSTSPARPKVVIIGGGFGGLTAAQALAGHAVDVTLIDMKNHHTFQPLLYQVATAVLSPGEIATPIRRILHGAANITVLLDKAIGFDAARQQLLLEQSGAMAFDYLIVAAGARHAYFGHATWERDAPGLKTIEDALDIRRRLLSAFEVAERTTYLTGHPQPLNFAIVGGGPTGVELAGAIADIARHSMAQDFRSIDTRQARVTVYEGAARVLGTYSEDLSRQAEAQLAELGVEVRTNSMVTAVEPGRIRVGDEWIATNVTFWATGIAASPLGKTLGVPVDRAGRVLVQPDLSIPGQPRVFVIGDMAFLQDRTGNAVPAVATAAIQEGKATAANIRRDLRGAPRIPFAYRDKGSMAIIGRRRAIAQIGRWHLTGFVAFALWGLVHIMSLIGFRSRASVLVEWIWAYFTRERSGRLITDLTNPRRES